MLVFVLQEHLYRSQHNQSGLSARCLEFLLQLFSNISERLEHDVNRLDKTQEVMLLRQVE
jgi:hypothetical protein